MTAVLITGANGFIARRLALTLKEAGLQALGTARAAQSVPGFDAIYPASLGDSLAAILAAQRVDAIVHAALDTGPDAYRLNVDGTTRWLEEARAAGVPLQLLVSSLSAAPDALDDYGRAKHTLEQRFVAADQVVFRLGIVVGRRRDVCPTIACGR